MYLSLQAVCCSLLCRTFDASLAEVCWEEGVGLLAYSPLAMGLLTVRPAYSSRHLNCGHNCLAVTAIILITSQTHASQGVLSKSELARPTCF